MTVADRFGCFVGDAVVQPGAPGRPSVAVKDNIDMAGLPTRAGLGRPAPVARQSAPVVRRLRVAGFTLIGKTRMDELALGASGENAHHGRTGNPRVPGASPGGSSSGSAAAVAAGLCAAALGTDTLGSVRIPAAYCGIVGLKPSQGVLPLQGVVPLSWTLDHVGLLGRSTAAVAAVLEPFLPRPAEAVIGPLFRVGIPTVLDALPMPTAWVGLFTEAVRVLAGLGWVAGPCDVPGWQPGETRRAGLLVIEAEAAVIHADVLADDASALSPGIRRMLAFGRDCGTGRLVRATQTLRLASMGITQALQGVDALLLPTVPGPGHWAGLPCADVADLVAPANFGGHPAISVPAGCLPDGRPFGLQLIGRVGDDWRLLDAAAVVERAFAANAVPATVR